jgi:branched-chain amino acid transport system substrate-binding protein
VPASGSEVTIGNVGTYSGVIGAIPQNGENTLFVWTNYINSCGGLDGHRVKVITADDGGDPSVDVSQRQKMVQQDHVIAFVGDFIPTDGQQAASYMEQANVPEVGGEGVSPAYYASKMLFPVTTEINHLALAAVKEAVKAGKNKFAVFYCVEVPQVCQALDTYVHANGASVGGTDVLDAAVSLTQPTYASQCQQAQSRGATFVIMFTDSASDKRAADDCTGTLNYHPLFATSSLGANATMQSDPGLQGQIVPQGVFPFSDNSTPAEALYHAQMAKFAPSQPHNGTTSMVWASAMLAAVAARGHLGANPTPAAMIQGLYSVKNNNLAGLTPPLTFPAGGVPAKIACYFNLKIVNYQWVATAGDTLQC